MSKEQDREDKDKSILVCLTCKQSGYEIDCPSHISALNLCRVYHRDELPKRE